MTNLQELMLDVLQNGDVMENRTGTNTISVVSRDARWSMKDGYNAVTTKKLAFKAVIGELLWFLSGSNNINDLRRLTAISDDDFCIWQKNLQEYREREMKQVLAEYGQDGEEYRKHIMNNPSLGYIYSNVWRKRLSVDMLTGDIIEFDQIKNLIEDIKAVKLNPSHPAARRLLVDAWDPLMHTDSNGRYCALPPCHYGYQCFVRNGKLSLKWIQRSVN